MGKPPAGARQSKCVLKVVDPGTRPGRDPFARPGLSGNRWIKYGCDGEIPSKYKKKLENAAKLAYALNNRPVFVNKFNELVTSTAREMRKGTNTKILSYLDALDKIVLNLAETSNDPLAKKEVKESIRDRKQDPTYEIAGGFTIGMTGRVYIREFTLAHWTEKQLASLIMHESCHVAGAPSDMLTEIVLSALYGLSYQPPTPK